MMPKSTFPTSVVEPHHLDAVLAPVLLNTKPTFLEQTIGKINLRAIFPSFFFWLLQFVTFLIVHLHRTTGVEPDLSELVPHSLAAPPK
jgi:hypothetical protein